MTEAAERAWAELAVREWAQLVRGAHVAAPPGMPHPSAASFKRPKASERHGQAADWVLALADGSRLHVHEYRDGTLVMHRDRHDPGRGVLSAARHLFAETRVGKALAVAGAIRS